MLFMCGLVSLLALVAVPAWAQPTAQTTYAFKRYVPLVPNATPALPPADEAARRIQVPAGFEIRIYAQNLNGKPRMMAFGPDGMLYITLMNAGQVARLPDRNGDGLSDGVEVVASNLYLPHGLEWRSGWLYVAESGKVVRLQDRDANGSLEVRETITSNIPADGGHNSRTLHFGPDGKLYVSAGSSCNVCVESDKRRATIMRFNPDGSIPADNLFANDPDPTRRPVWAEGLRNSVDFLWTPAGKLWANHNGSDGITDSQGLPDTRPPEEIVINVERGKHYGWPFCYTPSTGVTPAGTKEVRDSRINFAPPISSCDQVVPAVFTDPAHSAPLGMTQGTVGRLPSGFNDDLFVAYHGSWNTNDPANYRDCKVQQIVVENGLPVRSQTFATGWRPPNTKCGAAETWGRPADVRLGIDGAMYISDDKGNRVYRVVYTGR
jgi:glucose/arabinose dehydrogenase